MRCVEVGVVVVVVLLVQGFVVVLTAGFNKQWRLGTDTTTTSQRCEHLRRM
jgi:hypothetical protein